MTNYKDLIDSLSNPDISKRNYDEAINQIGKRVDQIWKYILKFSNRELEWYAFQNDVSYGRGNGSSGGHFDPVEDAEFIHFEGAYDSTFEIEFDGNWVNPEEYLYNDGFPTELIWNPDWKTVVEQHTSAAIAAKIAKCAKNKEKNAAKKIRKADRQKHLKELRNNILAKTKQILTEEEYKFLEVNTVNYSDWPH